LGYLVEGAGDASEVVSVPVVNPDRVVACFKAAKRWAYKNGDLSLAWLHVARTFKMSISDVKRIVYEAKQAQK
jgi:hypothetical protein